jgi:beta-glucosidase
VQVYVSAPSPVVRRPVRELRAFDKVVLEPGRGVVVRFKLGWRDFAYFHPGRSRWTVEAVSADIQVGASSRDIRLTGTVRLPVTEPRLRITPDSVFADWLSTPAGEAVLRREMLPPPGMGHAPFLTPGSRRTMGSVPLRRMARFPGAYLDPGKLDRLAAEVNAANGAAGSPDAAVS